VATQFFHIKHLNIQTYLVYSMSLVLSQPNLQGTNLGCCLVVHYNQVNMLPLNLANRMRSMLIYLQKMTNSC